MIPTITGLHLSGSHDFSKAPVQSAMLVAGIGLAGDVHAGARVTHRSRVAADATQPNLRQVHLIHQELLDELADAGHDVGPGQLGENVTTAGLDLLALGTGTILRLGGDALLAVTGLRNPCGQIDRFQAGLLGHLRTRSPDGGVVRRAGVMAVVVRGGAVSVGDPIGVASPPGPPIPLEPV